MADALGHLERAKRRKLREEFADGPAPAAGDRQAKLRALLIGAAADAAGGGDAASADAVRAMAAAAAASIHGAANPVSGKHRAAAGSAAGPRGDGSRAGSLLPSSAGSPANGHVQRSWSAPQGPGARATPQRAAPFSPSAGGFIPDADPIQRLRRLPTAWQQGAAAAAASPAQAAGGAVLAPRQAPAAEAGARGPGVVLPRRVPTGAVAVPQAAQSDDEDATAADVPSDLVLALFVLRSALRAHAPADELPPLALRSQLSVMLVDRSSIDRLLDEERLANHVRTFKLPTGVDEFGILITSDYRTAVRQAADAAASASAAPAAAASSAGAGADALQGQRRAASAPGGLEACGADAVAAQGQGRPGSGAYGDAASPARGSGGSRWHIAAELFLSRVVDRFMDFQLTRAHLLHLLQQDTPPGPEAAARAPSPAQRAPTGRGGAATMTAEQLDEQVSLLLHMGCLARHLDGEADAYLLAVPQAGKVVKSVIAGRRELVAWLGKRQYKEAHEEQVLKLKLRGSCLPPIFHVRDLVGRGTLLRVESTTGAIVRLAGAARP